MLKTEEVEQQIDYVDFALAIAEEECARCRHHRNTEYMPCSSCSIGAVREHLEKAHNTLIQIANI